MHEHTVDLTTACGPLTAEFSRGRLTGSDIAAVHTRRGFGVSRHEYAAEIFRSSPGWTEAGAHPLYDTTFAGTGRRHPFPRDRAAMMAAIRAAIAGYAAQAGAGR